MPVEQPHFEEMNQVVELYIQNVNPTKIAKEVGIRRVDVLKYIDEWKASAVGNEAMKDRVEELISSMDKHYSMLIQKAYEIIDEVDSLKNSDKETMTRSQMLSQKKGALDLIAKLEKDRIDVLQKSGLLEAADVGAELVALQDEMDRVLDLMDEHLCKVCRPKIMGELRGENTVVVISD